MYSYLTYFIIPILFISSLHISSFCPFDEDDRASPASSREVDLPAGVAEGGGALDVRHGSRQRDKAREVRARFQPSLWNSRHDHHGLFWFRRTTPFCVLAPSRTLLRGGHRDHLEGRRGPRRSALVPNDLRRLQQNLPLLCFYDFPRRLLHLGAFILPVVSAWLRTERAKGGVSRVKTINAV